VSLLSATIYACAAISLRPDVPYILWHMYRLCATTYVLHYDAIVITYSLRLSNTKFQEKYGEKSFE
jgi:hypothetical protein